MRDEADLYKLYCSMIDIHTSIMYRIDAHFKNSRTEARTLEVHNELDNYFELLCHLHQITRICACESCEGEAIDLFDTLVEQLDEMHKDFATKAGLIRVKE